MFIVQMAFEFQEIAPMTTLMVAICVIITSVFVPILTALYFKKVKSINLPVNLPLNNLLLMELYHEKSKKNCFRRH